MYALLFILILIFVALLLLDIKKAVLLFFAASISIQYLENYKVGTLSALDLFGGFLPVLLLLSLFINKGSISKYLVKDSIHKVFMTFLIFTFICNVIFSHSNDVVFLDRLGLWMKFFNGFVVFAVVSTLFNTEEKINKFLRFTLLALLIPCSIAIWQLITGNTVSFWQEKYQVVDGFFHHPAVLAFGLAITFPIILFLVTQAKSRKHKLSYIVLAGIILILTISTYRRTVWIGIATQFLVWFILKKKFIHLLVGFLIICGILYFHAPSKYIVQERFSDFSSFFTLLGSQQSLNTDQYDKLLNRWGIIRANIQAFKQSNWLQMLFGRGFGMSDIIPLMEVGNMGAHNIYLSLLINNGVIGFIIYITILGLVLTRAKKSLSSHDRYARNFSIIIIVLLISYFTMGLATHLFYELTTGVWIFWGLIGAFNGYTISNVKRKKQV